MAATEVRNRARLSGRRWERRARHDIQKAITLLESPDCLLIPHETVMADPDIWRAHPTEKDLDA